jgi:hypothetical protein
MLLLLRFLIQVAGQVVSPAPWVTGPRIVDDETAPSNRRAICIGNYETMDRLKGSGLRLLLLKMPWFLR